MLFIKLERDKELLRLTLWVFKLIVIVARGEIHPHSHYSQLGNWGLFCFGIISFLAFFSIQLFGSSHRETIVSVGMGSSTTQVAALPRALLVSRLHIFDSSL